MLCPLTDPETGGPVSFDGRPWPADLDSTLTALGLLSEQTLDTLITDFPTASVAAREHLGESVGMLASAVANWLCTPVGPDGEHPAVGPVCCALVNNVANSLAFRVVLDGLFGPEGEPGLRGNQMPVALKAFETGDIPRPPRTAEEDTDEFTAAVFPAIDYLSVNPRLREKAAAHLMAFSLSYECHLPYTDWRTLSTPPRGVEAFFRAHLHEPERVAAAVRARRTLNPVELSAALLLLPEDPDAQP